MISVHDDGEDKRSFGGWSTSGIRRYSDFCSRIAKARDEPTRRSLELFFYDKMVKQGSGSRRQRVYNKKKNSNLVNKDDEEDSDEEGDEEVFMYRDW